MACNDPLVVGAIDLGTTFSGWAYLFRHEYRADPTKAMVKHWYSGTGSITTEKTPSCVLIKPDGKSLEAFGYEAENKYICLAEEDKHRNYFYFRRFKMDLYKEKVSRERMIKDEMGKSLPALTVFQLSIAYLANDMITSCGKTVAGGINKEDVHWVLTVPTIWTDAGKQFMREAAVKAGIETEKLSIALEPEAASVFCRHLPVEKSTNECISSLPPGAKYMVLDAGGGTIDITIHKVPTAGGLKEVHAASGGGWGGVLVDNSFKELLLELFGEAVYKSFTETYTDDWVDLWRTFESKKKTIDPVSTEPINMKLPVSLLQLFQEKTGKDFKDTINKSKYSSTIAFIGGDKVKLASSLMEGLFNISISTTVSHVTALLKDKTARDVKAILMVGGFSESAMLQNAMKREFPEVKMIIPRQASTTILRGAVIFGYNRESISKRVLQKTYGIETSSKFMKGHDPEYLKTIKYGKEQCRHVFSKHVEKGKSVKVGEPQVKHLYTPLSDDQLHLDFHVFASDLKDPKYTVLGCEYVGNFSIDISNLPKKLKLKKKKVSVSLTFSGTEITATARVKETGETTSASFDFL